MEEEEGITINLRSPKSKKKATQDGTRRVTMISTRQPNKSKRSLQKIRGSRIYSNESEAVNRTSRMRNHNNQ